MATVRMSGELRERIVKNARAIYQGRIEKAEQRDPTWGDRFYEMAFGKYKEQLATIDPAWLRHGTSFNIQAEMYFNADDGTTYSSRVQEQLETTRPVPIPCAGVPDDIDGLKYQNGYGFTVRVTGEQYRPLIQEMANRNRNIARLHSERDTFAKGIAELLNAHSTLAPALRALPSLWDLIPDEIKEKHKEVKVAEKKAPVEIKADIGALNAAMTLHKLTK